MQTSVCEDQQPGGGWLSGCRSPRDSDVTERLDNSHSPDIWGPSEQLRRNDFEPLVLQARKDLPI